MRRLKKLPFREWCWRNRACPDEDDCFNLREAAQLLGVSIEQVLAWLGAGFLDSLAASDVEAAYLDPLPTSPEVPSVNPRTGVIEYP